MEETNEATLKGLFLRQKFISTPKTQHPTFFRYKGLELHKLEINLAMFMSLLKTSYFYCYF